MISKVCHGFFADPKHLEKQFLYLTDANISKTIERTLVGHLGSIEIQRHFSVINILRFREHGGIPNQCP